MSALLCVPRPPPWVNRLPPARAAAFDSWRSLRGPARAPPVDYGDGLRCN
jgi:hypothetical protein